MLLVPLTPLVEPTEAVSARSQPCGGSICINEVMPNPNGYDDAVWPNGEWLNYTIQEQLCGCTQLVFLQQGCKNVDVGFKLHCRLRRCKCIDLHLAPGDYMVVARNGASNFYVANSNDFMTLYDSSSGWIDEATWNSSSSGVSLEEDPANAYNDWIPTSNPTPGSSNSGGGTGGQPMPKAMSSSMRSWPTLGQVTITPLARRRMG